MGLPVRSKFGVTQLYGNLWQGGVPEAKPAEDAVPFDVVVLCAEELQKPTWQGGLPGFEIIRAPMDDCEPIRDGDLAVALQAAQKVSDRLRKGKRVLSTCHHGRNRSGLVSAMALVMTYGMKPSQAVALIQGKRSGALSNRAFVSFLLAAERNRRT